MMPRTGYKDPAEYIEERVAQYRSWYDAKAVVAKKRYLRMRILTVVGGMLVPVRVVCGRGRNTTLSRCRPSVAVQALRFRRRGPSGPAHTTGPAVRRTCRASPA